MSASRLAIVLAAAAAAVQLAVPVWMIARHEHVLGRGEVFKFRTAPVDPYDAFRGRYVALRFEEDSVPASSAPEMPSGVRVCVAVTNGPDGFARYGAVTTRPPATGAWLRTRTRFSHSQRLNLVPFADRYSMPESEAPAAETAYRKHSAQSNRTAWAQVRILDGRAAIEELYVDGVPIREFVRAHKASEVRK